MLDAQESDERMDSVISVRVNGGRVDEAHGEEESVSPNEHQVAEEISLQKMRLEDTVRKMYPSLLAERRF
ncbi:hypothetical protein PPTG_10482 [Phytophthora nicotianae INRA-310]|uniref:Uncharacterized protein n=1 Tax=Phytophthora nicotianae (strain INRA-310) TaxID=761204 RepID=W2QDK3_PHYN3|nr:hypothetical protein PPTG_10482 [Phytophthora nicotianae INRA-310]ETN10335.1 hypothetical protein PPTG_10482 [Phytophthora nicotianae INRA-310]